MSLKECAWCGEDIAGDGVKFSKMVFCSVECRDDYQDDLASQDDSELEDVDEGFDEAALEDLDLEDEDYIEDEEDEGDLVEDDDF
jgi:hypothetical protein